MPEKSKRGDTRSKYGAHRTPSTSKYSEPLFLMAEKGTIARIDDVLECCDRPSNARLSGANVNSANK
jgi:hypothetical protein